MRIFFTRIHMRLRPGGLVIATVPNCDALGELYARAVEDAAPGEPMRVSNALFSVSFEEGARECVDQVGDDCLDEAFGKRWGLPYRFSLTDAVDEQEEYNVPWEAFEAMLVDIGFNVILDAGFPEVLSEYAQDSKFYNDFFCKDSALKELSADEEEVFGLYNAFVLERV